MYKISPALFTAIILLFSLPLNAEEKLNINDIKQQAAQGDSQAQAKLGAIYHLGENIELPPTARYQMKKNFKAIEHLLADITQDHKQSTNWMLKAVKQGNIEAEMFMAAMYDRGMGVAQNTSKATDLYKKASAQGNTTAAALLGRYASSRLQASKDIPLEYAVKILTKN